MIAAPLMSVPAVGTMAPEFSLASTAGTEITLSEFRGKSNVLLAFFPLAFTSTCTAEVCAFSEEFDRFVATDTVVLPISVDAVPSLKAYKAQEKFTVDLLSDFKREVCRLFGVLHEERFLAKRSYIIIDKAGVIRWTWVEEHNGLRRENDELLAQLAALT